MVKRFIDVVVSTAALLIASPVLVVFMVLISAQDRKSPLYIAPRVGKGGREFSMVKLRSMVVDAASTGVDSTGASDSRITKIGHVVRNYKLDELTQLWNVLKGDMSLVGPRPNVRRETDLYTAVERHLLDVRPGITDFSSIVFADEGEILDGFPDPDLAYNQLIRPWKSRLGLFYVTNRSAAVDVKLLWLTAQGIVSRQASLRGVEKLLRKRGAEQELCQIALRIDPLIPTPPPGAYEVVASRKVKHHGDD